MCFRCTFLYVSVMYLGENERKALIHYEIEGTLRVRTPAVLLLTLTLTLILTLTLTYDLSTPKP